MSSNTKLENKTRLTILEVDKETNIAEVMCFCGSSFNAPINSIGVDYHSCGCINHTMGLESTPEWEAIKDTTNNSRWHSSNPDALYNFLQDTEEQEIINVA